MSYIRYEFNEAERELFRPKFLYLTESKYDATWYSTMHAHPHTEIIFVIDGTGKFLCDGKSYAMTKGDVVIALPNILHTETSDMQNPLEYIILGVSNVLFQTLEDENEEFNPIFPFHHHFDRTIYPLRQILSELENKRTNYHVMIDSHLIIFLTYLMRHSSLKILPDVSEGETKTIQSVCASVKSYLDSHYSHAINLDELAERTCMSKFHFIRCFKDFTGKTPINYLLERRITEAKTLLTTTQLSVAQISGYVGFSSQSFFAQRFKTSVGVNPTQYRKQKEKQTPPPALNSLHGS